MNEIDALAQAIRRADGDHTMGAGALAEALYSEGYRKPRIIESTDALNALPLEAVILPWGSSDRVWARLGSRSIYHEWHCPDGGFVRRENGMDLLPAVVIHEPETKP